MNSALMLIGAILLASGLGGGWFCYSRVSSDNVHEASYALSNGTIPDGSLWLIGAIVGLILMVSGMVLLFVAMVGIDKIMPWVEGFKEVFG
ncbi:hypothetical protein KF728_04370 [Candidatus Obscuribacterales bacterium]|nr:hypothetical protein [Candidatus Obscuribacterales bacterium]MBX3149370.1 hypothetical protein [Candidatus Obscuribacterales bacterium]